MLHRMAAEWAIRALRSDCCVASVGNVGILLWRREPTPAGIEEASRLYSHLAQTETDGLGWMVIVQSLSGVPSEEVKNLLRDTMHRLPAVKAFASVHESEGFQAASLRAVSTGLTVSTRTPYTRKLFGNTSEAAHWLAQELSRRNAGHVTALEILEVLAAIKARLTREAGGG